MMPNKLDFVNPNESGLAKKLAWSKIASMPTSSKKPYEDIGQRLKWHRDLLGLEQEEYIAKSRAIKRTTYSNWEVGSSRLSLNGAMELVDMYGLSLDFLYFGSADTLPLALRNAWISRSDVNA